MPSQPRSFISWLWVLFLSFDGSLANLHDLDAFNKMLVDPIGGLFTVTSAPNDIVLFYKSFIEDQSLNFFCNGSNQHCNYLQNSALIAAGTFFAGSAFCIFCFAFLCFRMCTKTTKRESVKMSQINSKRNFFCSVLAIICAFIIGLIALDAIYIQGTLLDNISNANGDLSIITEMLLEFETLKIPATAAAALNITNLSLGQLRVLIVDSGLLQDLEFMKSLTANIQTQFSSIYGSLQALRFDLIQNSLADVSVAALISGTNIIGNMTAEFTDQHSTLTRISDFSKTIRKASIWISPWVSSSWPWLLGTTLSFLILQSVAIRSVSLFSAVIVASTLLQLLFSFFAFIFFALTISIGDACTLSPTDNLQNWNSLTEASFFWNRVGKGCLSGTNNNLIRAFDDRENASCGSFFNVAQHSHNVNEILKTCENLHSIASTSNLSALQSADSITFDEFLATRNQIDILSAKLQLKWPQIFVEMQRLANSCDYKLESSFSCDYLSGEFSKFMENICSSIKLSLIQLCLMCWFSVIICWISVFAASKSNVWAIRYHYLIDEVRIYKENSMMQKRRLFGFSRKVAPLE